MNTSGQIDALKSKIEELNTELAGQKKPSQGLADDVDNLTYQLSDQEAAYYHLSLDAIDLQEKLELQAPLVSIAGAARVRNLELSKNHSVNGLFVGRTDWTAVKNGNSAVHHGNFDVDRAYHLKSPLSASHHIQFAKAYGVPVEFQFGTYRQSSCPTIVRLCSSAALSPTLPTTKPAMLSL